MAQMAEMAKINNIKQQIRFCLQDTTRQSALLAYQLLYTVVISNSLRKYINEIIQIFKEYIYETAENYNNALFLEKYNYEKARNFIVKFTNNMFLAAYDRNHREYIKKTDYIKVMSLYIDKYDILPDVHPSIQELINNAWSEAESKAENIRLCGCISVVKELPAGNPPFIGRLISSYLYEEEVARFNEIH